MSRETQRIDDYAWLEVLEMDPRASVEEIDELRSRVIGKWGISPEEMSKEIEEHSNEAQASTSPIHDSKPVEHEEPNI